MNFKSKFTRIKDLSDRRRLPRIGIIRLGVKVRRQGGMTKKCNHPSDQGCNYCSYPRETSYFVVPPEVAKVFGDKPTELDVLFPVEDEEIIFRQMYCYWGQSRGFKCRGNGSVFERVDEKTGEIIEGQPCPTPDECAYCKDPKGEPQCSAQGVLQFLIPKVSIGGVFQITTGSYHSIVDVNSGIDYVRALTTTAVNPNGRIAFLPMILSREVRTTHGSGRKETHYTLKLRPSFGVDQLVFYRDSQYGIVPTKFALPEPAMINPALGDDAVLNGFTEEQDPVHPPDAATSPPAESREAAVTTNPSPPTLPNDVRDPAHEQDDWPEVDEESTREDNNDAHSPTGPAKTATSPESCDGFEKVPPSYPETTHDAPPAPDSKENLVANLYSSLLDELAAIGNNPKATSNMVSDWLSKNPQRISQLPAKPKTPDGPSQGGIVKYARKVSEHLEKRSQKKK